MVKSVIKVSAWLLSSLLFISGAAAWAHETADDGRSLERRIQDAWIQGKLETAYAVNSHLNPFRIDTAVTDGVVHLTGAVESDIDKDLAGEIAKGVEGVRDVDNDLSVEPDVGSKSAQDSRRDFGQWIDDATTTASVKSKLMANGNIRGLDIDVETRADVVTLTGIVDSDEQRQLAEELARNTGDVADVRNDLRVASSD